MGDVEVLSPIHIELEPKPGPFAGLEPDTTIGPVTEISRASLADRLGSEHCNGHGEAYIGHAVDERPNHRTRTSTTTPTVTASKPGSNGSAHRIGHGDGHSVTSGKEYIDPNDLKDLEKNGAGPRRTGFRSFRASFTHASKRRKCINMTKRCISSPFGVMCLILLYLSLGACAFMWMEREMERTRRQDLINGRYELADTLIGCKDDTEIGHTECLVKELKLWEKKMIKFPMLYVHLDGHNSSEPRIWNWPNAFYGCFSIITTIGYGTIAPLTSWGRLFAVVYAVIGIPLMLLLVADIGGQLARVVKIAIIAFRKRRETAMQNYRQNKRERKTTADSTATIIEPDPCNDSPCKEPPEGGDRFEYMKGRINLGLDYDDDEGEVENTGIHKNDVKDRQKGPATTTDYESEGSNCADDVRIGNVESPGNRRKYEIRKDVHRHSYHLPEIKIEISDYDNDDRPVAVDEDGGREGEDDNRVEVPAGDYHDESVRHGDELNDHRDHDLYDAIDDPGRLPIVIELPLDDNHDHQIKDCDSISQCSTNSSASSDNGHKSSGMLDVPNKTKCLVLKLSNDLAADLNYPDSAVSLSSSVRTTASNAPTELYTGDDKHVVKSRIRDAHDLTSVSTQTSRMNMMNTPPIIRIDKASESDCSSSSYLDPCSPDTLRKRRLKRSPSIISSISVNMQQPRLPSEYNGRVAGRKRTMTGVTFGASLGSFSNVSENDIALFSIPLWFALLLLLIYLLIGASCYTAMEGWSIIDSFYYAFISLSTVGFGDLYFVPESFEGALIFNMVYCFIGLSFVSMVWGLSSREFTLLARKIARNLGYYKSRRWRRTVKGWTSRMRSRSKRWSSRRRNGLKETGDSTRNKREHASGGSSYSSEDEQ